MWRKLLGAILALATTDVASHAQKPLPFSCDDAVIPKQGDFLPIFFLHGLGDDADEARRLFEQLKQLNAPYACSIPLFENKASETTSLSEQIPAIIDFIRKKAATFDGHYQLVGHSMGALLFRAVLQEMDDHRAEHAVLIAGPLEGVYGEIGIMNKYFPNIAVKYIHTFAYTSWMQNHLSVANMWHDPDQEATYLSSTAPIPALDGHRKAGESEDDHHKRLARYRSNFNRVKKIYLLVSPADEMIIPWQTSHFGFYAQGSTDKIDPFDKQETSRTLGLDSMVAENVMQMITVPGIRHTEWCYNADVVRQHVIPRLAKIGHQRQDEEIIVA
eukprot:GEMP01027866.1.p1 GENE.GEMP01027866.1~~GEMP01027866.1.p1  ORF type:complete len:348 (+),score=46.73 GEMP01027866.1:56-1045(+)